MWLESVLLLAGLAFILAIFFGRSAKGGDGAACYDLSDGERQPHRWGYTDTRFEFDGPRSVRVTGCRYPLAGYSMPHFIPFVEEKLGLSITAEDAKEPRSDLEIAPARIGDGVVAALEKRFGKGQVSLDDDDRLIHSHGQVSVDEIYRILYRGPLARCVDVVVYPESEEDVRDLVQLAAEHDLCLVPYGGGTNVSGALTCPVEETRTIVSVDLRRMNRIVWLDEDNDLACIEAGISGKELERELDKRGYTSGHDPDSIELLRLERRRDPRQRRHVAARWHHAHRRGHR